MTKLDIAGIIIARDEETNIAASIQSLDFCSQVYVADDSSEDHTVQIAQSNGAKIIRLPQDLNFAEKRNFACQTADAKWTLFLDSDEKISQELRDEITDKLTKQHADITAYYICRRDFFWGKELRWGEVRKARTKGIIRLMQKDKGRWEGAVHEVWITKGEIGRLDNFIDHTPHPTLKEFIGKVNLYSTLRAKQLIANGEKPSIVKIVFYPAAKFMLTYFLYLGFLDGAGGFIYSFIMSFHSFLVRAKIYQYSNIKDGPL